MQLTASSDKFWKASFTDEAGRLIYKFDSPLISGRKKPVTLYRGNGRDPEVVGQLQYDQFNARKSSIKLTGSSTDDEPEIPVAELLRRSSVGGTDQKYEFRTRDGTAYEWTFGKGHCLLHAANNQASSEALIVFNRPIFGVLSRTQQPSLEILDVSHNVVPMALLALAYLEKHRGEERRNQAQSVAAACGYNGGGPV
ncbi:hypothetical protein CVT24_002826 [Panaeolus cyanescens]|uniref:DUF6593 domain-containing protein n=1 Tax=Panaeolus cyanescens TaxID=181874 RepID=A0A409YRG0_9AGAR|nr:hypothetical protein CVT24_002826 [Panaeolus cyanescens]